MRVESPLPINHFVLWKGLLSVSAKITPVLKSYVVQIVDREQELMSTAGLQSLGGGAGLGRGGLDRQLRIVPSTHAP